MSTQENHAIISPAILYWGTPVVLISTENADGSCNVAPMSSAWWLGHSCILGLDASSKTTENLLHTKQCVLNLPEEAQVAQVDALARTTGTDPVTASKLSRGYRFVKDKWACAGITPQASDFVTPTRIRECPVQMECQLVTVTQMSQDLPDRTGLLLAIEVRVLRTHVFERLRMAGHPNRIDPDKWRPLIMNFQEFYGLSAQGKIAPSVLGQVPEEAYRGLTQSEASKGLPGDGDAAMAEEQFNKESEAAAAATQMLSADEEAEKVAKQFGLI